MTPKYALLAMLIAASGATAADRLPPPGSVGFNWLDADSRCRTLTAKDIAAFSSCSASADSFGLRLASHTCKVDDRTELMVYRTAAQCRQALETMQANAP